MASTMVATSVGISYLHMVIIKHAVFRILISDVGGVVYTNLFNLYYNIALVL
jgi:hypothetical protein